MYLGCNGWSLGRCHGHPRSVLQASLLSFHSNQVTGAFVAFKEAFLESDANKQLPHSILKADIKTMTLLEN